MEIFILILPIISTSLFLSKIFFLNYANLLIYSFCIEYLLTILTNFAHLNSLFLSKQRIMKVSDLPCFNEAGEVMEKFAKRILSILDAALKNKSY